MRPRVTDIAAIAGCFCLCVLAPSFAPAAAPPAQTFNPVERASFHQLMFADEDVAVLNNLYPPGGDSGFHTHYRDLFAVIIQSSRSRGQGLGKPLAESTVYPVGATAYSPVGDEPRTHRVVNSDDGVFQIIVIELRRAKPHGDAVSVRDAAPPYEQILDNARMRAWRLILEPGQSASPITQGGKGLRVVVRGGLLTTMTPGAQDQTLSLRPGDVALQTAGTTRALKNSGTETIEVVDVELK